MQLINAVRTPDPNFTLKKGEHFGSHTHVFSFLLHKYLHLNNWFHAFIFFSSSISFYLYRCHSFLPLSLWHRIMHGRSLKIILSFLAVFTTLSVSSSLSIVLTLINKYMARHFLYSHHTSSISHSLPPTLTPSLSLSPSLSFSNISIFLFLSKIPQTDFSSTHWSWKQQAPTRGGGKNQCGRPPKDYSTYWAVFLFLTA